MANATYETEVRFGRGANYSETEEDGTWEFHGTATVWDDIITPFDFAKVPASNAPTWASFQGNLNAYTFADGDFLEITTELLHGYKEGSDIELHVHWATNGLEGTDKAVEWEVEYTIANPDLITPFVGDAFPGTTVVSAETIIPANTPDLSNMYTSVAIIDGTNFKMGAILKARVRRITAAGTAPVANPFGLNLGLHYEEDTVGSRTLTAK